MKAEELKDAAKRGDWPAYFAALHRDPEPELKVWEPEVVATLEWPEGLKVPSAVAGLVKLAEEAGWLTEVRYARGSVICRRKGPDGTMGRIVERRHSVAVRLWHPRRQLHAIALWEAAVEAEKLSWKADLAKLWAAGAMPTEVGVQALKETVRERRGS